MEVVQGSSSGGVIRELSSEKTIEGNEQNGVYHSAGSLVMGYDELRYRSTPDSIRKGVVFPMVFFEGHL